MFTKRTIYNNEHEMFRESFRKFLHKEVLPFQDEWEQAGIIPREIYLRCGEQGFLVPQAPEEYGGLGIHDFRYECIMLEELARASPRSSRGISVKNHDGLFPTYAFLKLP